MKFHATIRVVRDTNIEFEARDAEDAREFVTNYAAGQHRTHATVIGQKRDEFPLLKTIKRIPDASCR